MDTSSIQQRRNFLQAAAGSGLAALSAAAGAQAFSFVPNQRYPDPSVLILDPSFAKYRIYSSTVEQVATGFRWAEGPVYFPKGGYLLFSDIPNNRIMKFDEATGKTSIYREKANYANGNARDRQGRLITCEHSVTRQIPRQTPQPILLRALRPVPRRQLQRAPPRTRRLRHQQRPQRLLQPIHQL